ncbi:MAG: class I SAM-dependent methyltransferase [Nitrososphaerota archaeon]
MTEAHMLWVEYRYYPLDYYWKLVLLHAILWVFVLIPASSQVLEVGFGSGTTAVLPADLGYRVTAVDIGDVLVERAQKRYAD